MIGQTNKNNIFIYIYIDIDDSRYHGGGEGTSDKEMSINNLCRMFFCLLGGGEGWGIWRGKIYLELSEGRSISLFRARTI